MQKIYLITFLIFITNVTFGQIINIPDPIFKNVLTSTLCASLDDNGSFETDVDTNNDGEIQVSEAMAIIRLNVSNNSLTNVDGVNNFTNLQNLDVRINQISSIDLSGLTLKVLTCSENQLTSLNLTGMASLEALWCSNNFLTELDLDSLPNLWFIHCRDNLFTSLDFSNTKVDDFYIGSNPNMNYINLKNGYITEDWHFNSQTGAVNSLNNLPLLQAICADEEELPSLQFYNDNGILSPAQPLTTYCSFFPGGATYTFQGSTHFDLNNDGCDENDILYPNLNLSITNGTITGNFISNSSSNYLLHLPAATHVVTPVFENPTYFNSTPASIELTFPGDTNPYTQNFCVAANGTHPDLEISILPLGQARPGFDAIYKLVYRNKGTVTQSGSISFDFPDAVMDLVSALPV
ncbi:MAG TPA: hypothetical protein VGB43_04135, partial [Flavobacterium sp.]